MRIGDTVQLIFTDEIGVIVGYQDSEVYIVLIDDLEIPVFGEHLRVIQAPKKKAMSSKKKTYNQQELEKQQAADKLKAMGFGSVPDNEPDRGVFLVLQPFYAADKTIEYFLLHLVNDTPRTLQVSYKTALGTQSIFSLNKEIGRRKKLILNSLLYDQLNEKPNLEFSFTLLGNPQETYQKQFTKAIRPRAKMLRKAPRYLQAIDNDGFIFKIVHQLPTKKVNIASADKQAVSPSVIQQLQHKKFEQQFVDVPKRKKVTINAEQRKIDLHIEKLMPNHKHLRKNEILQVQIARFEQELKEAIKREEKQMTVIHGLGKGKLKSEIIKRLRFYDEVASIKDGYTPKYGFGATEIIFDYEPEKE